MKTYVLMVALTYPKGHILEGQDTHFIEKIECGQKIHTIRDNYDLWFKRVNEINAGRAVLSLRYWTDKPYRSKQREFAAYRKVNLQTIKPNPLAWVIDGELNEDLSTATIARNDGLSFEAFKSWFNGAFNIDEPKAIIHFTDFKY